MYINMSYMDDWEKFEEEELTTKSALYSDLKMKNISY